MWNILSRGVVLHVPLVMLLCCVTAENDRPIIGILAQEAPADSPGDTFIRNSYVGYLEGSGARVAVIRVRESDEYYRYMFNSINGLLFPGGRNNLQTSEFAKAGQKFYKMALEANQQGDYFPLWGTCQGFEFLAVTTAEKDLMNVCSCEDVSLPLSPLPAAKQSRLLKLMSDRLYQDLITENLAANFHVQCLTPKNFSSSKLSSFYRPLSTNQDKTGKTFISMMEAYDYPIYGTQFHPEKNNFMWDVGVHVNHTQPAVQMSQYFANFFVSEARKNSHKFPDAQHESDALIYNYPVVYSGATTFELNYYFNYTHNEARIACPVQHTHRPKKTQGTPLRLHRHFPDQHARVTVAPPGVGFESYPLVLMGLGMVACLFVGLQLGRCMEAHSHSETWPDVLSWLMHNQRHLANNRRPAGTEGPTGQRVRLLHTDKHYFTVDENEDDEL